MDPLKSVIVINWQNMMVFKITEPNQKFKCVIHKIMTDFVGISTQFKSKKDLPNFAFLKAAPSHWTGSVANFCFECHLI